MTYYEAKPKLKAILMSGGATGQHFTSKQIVAYIGKYIEINKLFDPLNKRIIHCKNDLLGEVFQCNEFIVTDDAYKNLWKLISPYLYVSSKKDSPPKEPNPNTEGGPSSSQETELPWWYFVDRQKKRDDGGTSQTTGGGSYDQRETIEVRDSDVEESEVEFYEEYEPVDIEDDSDATVPVSSDEDEFPQYEIESLQQYQSHSESDGETTGTDFSIESDITLEEYWSCDACRTKNSPTVGYCQRCWKLRKGWVRAQETLTRSATDPITSSSQQMDLSRSASLDVCDGVGGKSGLSESGSQSTISSIIPSFSSALKHKLEVDDSKTSEQSAESKPKVPHLDIQDPSPSPMSATTSTTNSSNEAMEYIGLCNICRNSQNNATMVHGRSGHQFCCYRCAKRLQKKGKNCPVCREPILLVIRNFVVQM